MRTTERKKTISLNSNSDSNRKHVFSNRKYLLGFRKRKMERKVKAREDLDAKIKAEKQRQRELVYLNLNFQNQNNNHKSSFREMKQWMKKEANIKCPHSRIN